MFPALAKSMGLLRDLRDFFEFLLLNLVELFKLFVDIASLFPDDFSLLSLVDGNKLVYDARFLHSVVFLLLLLLLSLLQSFFLNLLLEFCGVVVLLRNFEVVDIGI